MAGSGWMGRRVKGLFGSANDAKELDEFGRSQLHHAASEGDVKKAQELIGRGADVNLADKQGWTPLHAAAQGQSAEVAKLLLDAGARLEAKDRWGNTPLMRAVLAYKGSGEFIQLLRARGADAFAENNYGKMPVGSAREVANYDVKRWFEDLG